MNKRKQHITPPPPTTCERRTKQVVDTCADVTNDVPRRNRNVLPARTTLSYGPPWAHYLGGYQDRLLGGPLGLPDLCRTVPDAVRRKDYGGEVLG
jgi:hypothetical protein